MYIICVGKKAYNLRTFKSNKEDTLTHVDTIEKALVEIEKKKTDMIIIDSDKNDLQVLYSGIRQSPYFVRVLLLFPDKPYFMVSGNNGEASYNYHLADESEITDNKDVIVERKTKL
jgi:hypothetical protein